MMRPRIANLSRRAFLRSGVTAGAGLTLGLWLPGGRASHEAGLADAAEITPEGGPFAPNAFLRIDVDDRVTVIAKHLEMDQGAYTGLATLVAEELDAARSQVRAEGAPADAERYANLLWGPVQGTGGSTALANSFQQMREAGAAARAMLVAAAAERWGVATTEIQVQDGVLTHAKSGRSARFGELIGAAARQPVPDQVALKPPAGPSASSAPDCRASTAGRRSTARPSLPKTSASPACSPPWWRMPRASAPGCAASTPLRRSRSQG